MMQFLSIAKAWAVRPIVDMDSAISSRMRYGLCVVRSALAFLASLALLAIVLAALAAGWRPGPQFVIAGVIGFALGHVFRNGSDDLVKGEASDWRDHGS